MAEIPVERKERSAWPWLLLGAVLVALVLWFLFGATNDEPDLAVAEGTAAGAVADPTTPAPAADPAGAAMPAAVTEFTQFVQTTDANAAGLAHEYTAEGLRRLAAALDAVAARATVASTVDVSERVGEIRAHADRLQQNPTSTAHALQAREGALLAAALMRQLVGTEGDAATAARDAYTTAEQIAPQTLLLDQVDTVRRFFDQSANVVRGLAAM